MKFSFSDKYFNSTSFIDLCNIAQNYGFDGIEISDANYISTEIAEIGD